MNLALPVGIAAVSLLGIASFVNADWDAPPVLTEQVGYRGTGMYVSRDAEKVEELAALENNQAPESPWDPDPEGDRAGDIYENVQVLGHLSDDEFNHFMASITEWVSPEQGCNYCHNAENYASDEVYTKVVSRRMIQQTQAINVDWKAHVKQAGVTCYTCHRGQPVPAEYWYLDVFPKPQPGALGYRGGQNVAGQFVGNTSMHQNALAFYMLEDQEIRVHSDTALPVPGANEATTKETEATWALMMHMSESLGANCTTCHNSRAFNDWDQSPPQRVTAWYGIRMARQINQLYMVPLNPVFPGNRKGPLGDVYKVGCATCHQGVQKPLYGAKMLLDAYVPSLGRKSDQSMPDYEEYVPGETQRLAPDGQSASLVPLYDREGRRIASIGGTRGIQHP